MVNHSRWKTMVFFYLVLAGYSAGQNTGHKEKINGAIDVTIVPSREFTDFGVCVACGDVNGDGYDDILIGHPVYNSLFEPVIGYVFVIYGGEMPFPIIDLETYTDYLTTIQGEDEKDIGSSVSVADINGDGIEDLITGAYKATSSGFYERGEVDVLYGISQGWGLKRDLSQNGPSVRILGEHQSDHLGQSVAAGDMNGDGLTDLVMGAPSLEKPGAGSQLTGGVFVLLQPQDQFSPLLDLSSISEGKITIYGFANNDLCGWDLAIRDVNRDGIDDFLIGAYKANPHVVDEGESYFIPGAEEIISDINLEYFQPTNLFQGAEFREHMGYAVALADLNGDGWEDFVLGSRQANHDEKSHVGKVRIMFGSGDSLGIVDFQQQAPHTEITGAVESGHFGSALCSGDVNGDGIEDLITGEPLPLIAQQTQAGSVHIFYGRENWPENVDLDSDTASLTIRGLYAGGWFGRSVASGDINGDGVDDVVIGAPKADTTGQVYIVFGFDETAVPQYRQSGIRDWVLEQNYPNPFNQETMIPILIPENRNETTRSPHRATIQIFNILGRMVQTWDLSHLNEGRHTIRWTGEDQKGRPLPSGIYFCRFTNEHSRQIRKITLLR
jgi:hypothetical protein